MRYHPLVIFLVAFSPIAQAQIPVPVFTNKVDSIDYAKIDKTINDLLKAASTEGNYEGIDSLFREKQRFMDTHPFVYKMVYRQDRSFTPYQLLPKIMNKDSITKISILGRYRRKMPDSLYMYKNLVELELIDFKLRRLPRKLRVRTLIISNNSPSKPLKLSRNSTISILTIRGDEKGVLPKKYGKLKALWMLTLARNNLTTFPNMDGCRELRTLNLNNNNIGNIDESVVKLSQLESLSLYKNNLKDIPDFMYTMGSLRVIDLYFNHISKVSPAIANWKNLEVLYLANNDMYSVPDEIGELKNLKELYLHHNRLSNLPASIGGLTSLNVLRINNNNMIEWPAGLTHLRKLVNFDCSSNQFESLPFTELDFRDMKILSIGNNPWEESQRAQIKMWTNSLRENNTVVHE